MNIMVIVLILIGAVAFALTRSKKDTVPTTGLEVIDMTKGGEASKRMPVEIVNSATEDWLRTQKFVEEQAAKLPIEQQVETRISQYTSYPIPRDSVPDTASWDAKTLSANADSLKFRQALIATGYPAYGSSIIKGWVTYAEGQSTSLKDAFYRNTGKTMSDELTGKLSDMGINVDRIRTTADKSQPDIDWY